MQTSDLCQTRNSEKSEEHGTSKTGGDSAFARKKILRERKQMDREQQKTFLQNIPYIQYNGIVIDQIGMEESVLHVEMRHELENPYGMAHGGLLFTLVDTVGGVTARADGRRYVTPDASIHYLKSGRKGRITATGHTVRRGRTVTVVDAAVTDEEKNLLASGTVTMFCLDADEKRAEA